MAFSMPANGTAPLAWGSIPVRHLSEPAEFATRDLGFSTGAEGILLDCSDAHLGRWAAIMAEFLPDEDEDGAAAADAELAHVTLDAHLNVMAVRGAVDDRFSAANLVELGALAALECGLEALVLAAPVLPDTEGSADDASAHVWRADARWPGGN